MLRVVTSSGVSYHLMIDGSGKTYCGHHAYGNAPAVVQRSNLCKNCFRGKQFTAQQLNLIEIVEDD